VPLESSSHLACSAQFNISLNDFAGGDQFNVCGVNRTRMVFIDDPLVRVTLCPGQTNMNRKDFFSKRRQAWILVGHSLPSNEAASENSRLWFS
jgi:hypothetical protein